MHGLMRHQGGHAVAEQSLRKNGDCADLVSSAPGQHGW